eukprot:gb/GFBE01056436.1/.p1 GENE.gb/GFBE01056436.1/~~gb/GFBE01056436.1/.p1  ORF type:complete len:191 (+),score=59.81 gb/GFBE01056436.1/:1-573(+)
MMKTTRRGLPLFPCLCLGLAFVLLAVTLMGNNLPVGDEEAVGFVASPASHRTLRAQTQMQARKFTAADRGTPEYEAYFREKKKVKENAWEMMTNPNAYRDAGVDVPDIGLGSRFEKKAPEKEWENDGLGSYNFGSPAPAPAPESAPASVPAPAEGGNPFQFIIDIFNPTTTTTTTTQPPNPIEAFFKSLR